MKSAVFIVLMQTYA